MLIIKWDLVDYIKGEKKYPAKTSVSPRSLPLGTLRAEEAKRPRRRRARRNGCFCRLEKKKQQQQIRENPKSPYQL